MECNVCGETSVVYQPAMNDGLGGGMKKATHEQTGPLDRFGSHVTTVTGTYGTTGVLEMRDKPCAGLE